MELDPADGGAATNDDSQLVIGMGDMGTVGFYDSEGGLSKELGYGIGALGTGTDYGNTMTIQYGGTVSTGIINFMTLIMFAINTLLFISNFIESLKYL